MYQVSNFSMSHSSIFLTSKTPRSSLYISHSPTIWALLYCFATRAHLCIFFLFPSTTGIPLFSFSFLAGPGALHELAVSAFLRCPLGRANTFSFLSPFQSVLFSWQTKPFWPLFKSRMLFYLGKHSILTPNYLEIELIFFAAVVKHASTLVKTAHLGQIDHRFPLHDLDTSGPINSWSAPVTIYT